jgi:hypothetical protein
MEQERDWIDIFYGVITVSFFIIYGGIIIGLIMWRFG